MEGHEGGTVLCRKIMFLYTRLHCIDICLGATMGVFGKICWTAPVGGACVALLATALFCSNIHIFRTGAMTEGFGDACLRRA